MSLQPIDLSQAPYWDDFNEDKKFNRILFKPGYPVQARELTQLQTIIQNQIEKFGKHVFDEGSLVYGGQFNIDNNIPFVKLKDTNPDTDPVYVSNFIGKTIIGETSGITAYVVNADSFVDENDSQTYKTLIIRYLSGSGTTASDVFTPGEVISTVTAIPGESISAYVEDSILSVLPTGNGSIFSIAAGVVFSNNFFINFEPQSIVLSAFTSEPTYRVGFLIDYSIITTSEDTTLLDNSQGFYNYASPGADRLKLYPILSKIDIDDDVTIPSFVELFTIKEGVVQQDFERSQYAVIGDEIAKRTFDESGDYCIKGMNIRIRENLNTYDINTGEGYNEGYLTLADGGDSSKLSIGIEPGLAYVKGYEVNSLVTKYISTPKSTDYEFANGQVTTARSGNYIIVNEIVGSPVLDVGQEIELYDTDETRITDKTTSNTVPTGTQIGTAKIKSIQYESGTMGTSNGKLRIYLFDILMSGGIFSDIKSVFIDSTVGFFADVVLVNTKATLNETSSATLLYAVGSAATRKITSNDDSTRDTTLTVQRNTGNITVDTNGTFSVSVSTLNEIFAYGVGVIGTTNKKTMILTCEEATSIALPGTTAGSIGTNAVVGTSTFFTRLNVGDIITFATLSNYYTIATITDNTHLTVVENIEASFSAKAATKEYIQGSIIDLNSIGCDAGVIRSATESSSTVLAFDLNETYPSTFKVSLTYHISKNTAKEITKTLKPNSLVKINCTGFSPEQLISAIPLGFSDIYKINEIRLSTSAFTSTTDGTDVTDFFVLNNGQVDDFYDTGSITPKQSLTLTTSHYLLINLDYFLPDFSQGNGYFSVDSYPIDDSVVADDSIMTHQIPVYTSSVSGLTYKLRDYLDFRPVKTNTASYSLTIGGASTNPSKATTFIKDSYLRIPVPSSQIVYDYSYYLARRDVITLNKTGSFGVINGVSALHPVTPLYPDTVMGVAKIYIPPYPSLSTTYARILGIPKDGCQTKRITYERHTMRDIGVLKERINNLEYYSAISLLERNAKDMLIMDENGLNRFKNGFFVDNCADHSLGATENSDYKIAVDRKEGVLRPYFNMESILQDYIPTSSTNITKTGNLLMLPYTEESLISQLKVTSYRNIDQSVYRFIGNLEMFPDTDVWVDTTVVDKTINIDFSIDLPVSLFEVEYGSWEWVSSSGRNITYERDVTTYETIETNTLDNIGTFVTDVGIIPYIRPQVILLKAKALKPNTRFHVFFDGEKMNDYVTPFVVPGTGIPDGPLAPNYPIAFLSEGSAWISNEKGELFGILRIPEDGIKFRIGTREIKIIDSLTNSEDATTFCVGYFVAYGLEQQKQDTILSTKNVVVEEVTTTRTKVITLPPVDCMAYSFYVKAPETEDAVFLTSVDVYIQALNSTLGCIFEIREMNSAGGITRTIVPYSEVLMQRDDPAFNIWDGTGTPVATRVTFPSPIILLNNTQYAFVIHTEGGNPDTYFWISRLGETDLITSNQVTARQFSGNVYTSNNNKNWDIVQDIDLMIQFNRASFDTTKTGTVLFGDHPQEFFTITTPSARFTTFGETINGSESLTLSGITGSDSFIVGDVIVGDTSLEEGTIISIDGSVYNTNGFDFIEGETFTVTSKDVTGTIDSITSGEGFLRNYDRKNYKMRLENSNGLFFNGCSIIGTTSGITSTISTIDGFPYSTINLSPNFITFANTTCPFSIKGITTGAGSLDSSFTNIIPKLDHDYSIEKSIYSRSLEVSDYSSVNTLQLRGIMNTTSNWVSPVIDISRTSAVLVHNIINDDVTGESDTSFGGNLFNKYISQTITLDEGQDAEDLRVVLSAYCPSGITSEFPIKVWMKIINQEDTGSLFAQKNWIELTNSGLGVYSSIADKYDFKDFVFTIPDALMVGTNGAVTYTYDGNVYSGFKQFAIKIGLLGTNSALVPKVTDIRVIALQK